MNISFRFFLLLFVGHVHSQMVTVSCDFNKFPGKLHEAIDHYNSYCSVHNNFTGLQKIELKFDNKMETEHVEALKFADNNILTIPDGIDTYFPQLKALIIIRSELTTITSEDFKKLTNLEFLNLNNNKIEVLEENLFKFNPKLAHILMIQNRIRIIDSSAFLDLNQLTSLDLSGNICIKNLANNQIGVLMMINKLKLSCWNETLELSRNITKIDSKINHILPNLNKSAYEIIRKELDDYKSQNNNQKDIKLSPGLIILFVTVIINFIAFFATFYFLRSTIKYFEDLKSNWNQHIAMKPAVQNHHSQPQNHLNIADFHEYDVIE